MVDVITQSCGKCISFRDIAYWSRGCVSIEVNYLSKINTRIFERKLHCASNTAARWVRRCNMVTVRGEALATEFCVDTCAALLRMFE